MGVSALIYPLRLTASKAEQAAIFPITQAVRTAAEIADDRLETPSTRCESVILGNDPATVLLRLRLLSTLHLRLGLELGAAGPQPFVSASASQDKEEGGKAE